MEDQLGALGLDLNAVVLRNTRYADAALNQRRATGLDVLPTGSPEDYAPPRPGSIGIKCGTVTMARGRGKEVPTGRRERSIMYIDPPTSLTTDTVHLGDLFTDRERESAAFLASVSEHRRSLLVDGPAQERRNILAFHGVGGVGKTTLSRRLESWCRGQIPSADPWGSLSTPVEATVRWDMHGCEGRFDAVSMLLALRDSVGAVVKRCPAFDVAFCAYWIATHPNQPLPTDEGGGHDVGIISESLISLASDLSLGPLLPIGLGVRAMVEIVRAARRRALHREAFTAHKGYADLLDKISAECSPANPRPDLVADMACLLTVDMLADQAARSKVVVVFVDAYEHLTSDPRHGGERLFNHVAYWLPHILFVVTGRNRIAWTGTRTPTAIRHAGSSIWPGLVHGASREPRQHLVGNLSNEDCLDLVHRIRAHDGLLISEAVAQALATASDGLPQYLDLARSRALTLREENPERELRVEDVTGTLGELVQKVLEDIPLDEQNAIRGAALFARFDEAMVAATAGVSHGCAARAMARPMIDHDTGTTLPYRMHDAIREAIRVADHTITNGWAEADWLAAAQRAFDAAQRRYESASASGDLRGAVHAVAFAVAIACEMNVNLGTSPRSDKYDNWLIWALVSSPSINGLYDLLPRTSRTAYGQRVLDFTYARWHDCPVEESLRLLSSIDEGTDTLAIVAARHRVYVLRNNAHFDAALAGCWALLERCPTELQSRNIPVTLSIARRFQDALDDLERDPRPSQGTHARVALAHGNIDAWIPYQESVLADQIAAGQQRSALESEGDLACMQAIRGRGPGFDNACDLEGRSRDVGHRLGVRNAITTKILLRPFDPTVDTWLEELRILEGSPHSGLYPRYILAACAVGYYRADGVLLEQVCSALKGSAALRSRGWIPLEFLAQLAGLEFPPTPTQWIEDLNVVQSRWFALWTAWRAQRLTESVTTHQKSDAGGDRHIHPTALIRPKA